jgi:hypothetical protein
VETRRLLTQRLNSRGRSRTCRSSRVIPYSRLCYVQCYSTSHRSLSSHSYIYILNIYTQRHIYTLQKNPERNKSHPPNNNGSLIDGSALAYQTDILFVEKYFLCMLCYVQCYSTSRRSLSSHSYIYIHTAVYIYITKESRAKQK